MNRDNSAWSGNGSLLMAHLLTGPHKKQLRFRRWPVRRRSVLMKCILHYLSAVLWQLSADKINTDVVKDSAVLEWERSPQSICAINSSLCAPLGWWEYTNSIWEEAPLSSHAMTSSYMYLTCIQLPLEKLYFSCLALWKSHIWGFLGLSVGLNADFACAEYASHRFSPSWGLC